MGIKLVGQRPQHKGSAALSDPPPTRAKWAVSAKPTWAPRVHTNVNFLPIESMNIFLEGGLKWSGQLN